MHATATSPFILTSTPWGCESNLISFLIKIKEVDWKRIHSLKLQQQQQSKRKKKAQMKALHIFELL